MLEDAERHADALSKLLPEGLTEASIVEIAELIDSVVNEQVEDKVKALESKVKAFIRLNVDQLKEHAMSELEATESTVRDAKLLESFRTLMALDTGKTQVDSAISDLSEENDLRSEEVDVLTEELSKVMEENSGLEDNLTVLAAKVARMEEELSDTTKKYKALKESSKKPFKSSEKALVIANDVDGDNKTLQENELAAANEFLTEDVMKFMPFSNNK